MSQEAANKATWSHPRELGRYGRAEGWTDTGEREAFRALADEFRDQPILDIGVGGGRTIPLLQSISKDYRAIDFVPDMVTTCRERFPDVDISEGDARDLSRFEDESFSLVTFSFNGIDSVDRAGRRRILEGVYRVLRPGGVFWFSTFNKTGPMPKARPWRPSLPKNPLCRENVRETLQTLKRMPRHTAIYLANRKQWQDAGDWSIGTISSEGYRLLMHFTTLANQIAELESAGFRANPTCLESSLGKPVQPGDDLSQVYWFHILARK